ncbi:DUF1801 domain-containing protein [Enterococcus sp. DIV0242_7C1]|uniref:YdhG-like domain-containing protein n=1 Tax=Candidatus Enterococcus dunnyi TaxID=1834192 RepID=A0A200JDE5_9ENTE|nr:MULTISPECIES: DUF1801 domain-containing protein [unclassified Enterococcus]MBO0470488.1 DUF1801 domain-containing protein [Enterococcus sp. DIV0242_7C1]OUZ34859.1 hypothetical protein A5889_000334 [Enterococcus sp. 9D6_DIV0238]
MADLSEFTEKISDSEQRQRLEGLFAWIKENFPQLETVIKWNQPMFTDHGTFIIGFSVSKKHMSIAPETVTLAAFKKDIEKAGYEHTDNIFKITWTQEIDFSLLKKIIDYNIQEKIDYTKFWRE